MIEHISARSPISLRRWLGRRMAVKAGQTTMSADLPAEKARALMDKAGDRLPVARDVEIERIEYAGRPALRFVPNTPRPGALLFLHGGGYSRGSAQSHKPIVSKLAAAFGVEAISLDYRLAPEHPCPAGIEDALAAWQELRSQTRGPIIVAGDSAGGGLSLALTLRLKERGEALPDALYLISPWTDLTITGESARSKAGADPMLRPENLAEAARLYAGEGDPASPDCSPLFANLAGLPPVLIQVGTDEILLDDSVRLAQRLDAAGVEVRCEVWDKMWHDFPLFAPLLPEANAAMKRVSAWAKPHLSADQS